MKIKCFSYLLIIIINVYYSNLFAWDIQVSESKMTDKKVFLMYQESTESVHNNKHAVLLFDCKKKSSLLELQVPNYIKSSSNPIKIRLDKEKQFNIYSFIFTDNKGAFLNDNESNSWRLINKLKNHKKMLIQYYPLIGNIDVIEFDLERFSENLEKCKKMK